MTTEEKVVILLTALKTEELKTFLVTCPDQLTPFVLNELETRMSEADFIKFCNEF